MLDQKIRSAILELHERGFGVRPIARALKLSRPSVRRVLCADSDEVPLIERTEKAEAHRDEIVELFVQMKGNLVRVHEELAARGAQISYQALTGFCRRHGIGHEPVRPEGRYHFEPGEEMQHDTSPHHANFVDGLRTVQIASLVLCTSRLIYIQLYPRFTRFECKVFLTDALKYVGGACRRCMIDNTSVVRLSGTGKDMTPVPEMASFAERFDFDFAAHEVGDADRSARVEGHFGFVQRNFLVGRTFRDWEHANQEAITWCDKVNAAFSPKLHASRRELFAPERPHLKPLPIWIPDVYQLHQRIVDAEGYVSVHSNRYSVPWKLIGRDVEVRESKDKIEVFDGPRLVASHRREPDPRDLRVTTPAHRPPRGQGRPKDAPEEAELLRAAPELTSYIADLKPRLRGRVFGLRRLLRLVRDYPRGPVVAAVRTAAEYGLFDLDRLERMVLRQIARDYFVLPPDDGDDEGGSDDEG